MRLPPVSHGVYLVVEVADVTNDGLVLHLEDVVERDDVAIAGGRHVDVADAERVLERGDWMISMMPVLGKTFHSFGRMNSIPTAGSFK